MPRMLRHCLRFAETFRTRLASLGLALASPRRWARPHGWLTVPLLPRGGPALSRYCSIVLTEMRRSLHVLPEFPELELSPQPAERRAKVRLLENVLTLIERRRHRGRVMRWADLPRFAETSAIVETTAARTNSLPADDDFESFDDLKSRRDDTGVVRRR